MSQESSPEQRSPAAAASKNVSLSRWVNERPPAWEQLLSAHDVARLTRRPRWVLLSLMLLGRFPRKQQFHGRGIGWLRSDVLSWLSQDLRSEHCHGDPLPLRSTNGHQRLRPRGGLHASAKHGRRGACCCHRGKNPTHDRAQAFETRRDGRAHER
jgi:predicted DNA-binding transcriptional regulator AlpA